MRNAAKPSPPEAALVAGKALTRAADLLAVPARDMADIVGLSEASLSRLKRGGLQLTGKAYELALLFIRVYRSLDAIMGGDDMAARRWLRADNSALGGQPLAKMKTIDGLTYVLAYLDARRAPV